MSYHLKTRFKSSLVNCYLNIFFTVWLKSINKPKITFVLYNYTEKNVDKIKRINIQASALLVFYKHIEIDTLCKNTGL